MTSREFGEWFTYAAAAFPALHRLFVPGEAETKARSKQWTAAFERLPLDKAKAAIDAMLAGKADPPKFDWSELPAKVLAYCGELANAELASTTDRYYDGPRYHCPHCQDSRSGFITIWNPLFVEACDEALVACENTVQVQEVYREWRRQDVHRHKYRTMAVVCCCDSPAAKTKRAKAEEHNARLSVFDPQRNCVYGALEALKDYLRDASRFEWEYSTDHEPTETT